LSQEGFDSVRRQFAARGDTRDGDVVVEIHQDLAQVKYNDHFRFHECNKTWRMVMKRVSKWGSEAGSFGLRREAKRHAALNRSIVPVSWLSAPKALSPLRFASAVQKRSPVSCDYSSGY
jgi:hypothetical protein